MSARKLSRLAGLVFVLAAILGGAAATTTPAAPAASADRLIQLETGWG